MALFLFEACISIYKSIMLRRRRGTVKIESEKEIYNDLALFSLSLHSQNSNYPRGEST
jgi:hypothetical protein